MRRRLINVAVGIWLMAAPAVLDYGGKAATNDRIVGPVTITFATIAIWESTRSVRWVNVILGVWLLLAPRILMYGPTSPKINSLVAGVLMIAFGLVRGPIEQQFGGGWRAIWHPEGVADDEVTRPPPIT